MRQISRQQRRAQQRNAAHERERVLRAKVSALRRIAWKEAWRTRHLTPRTQWQKFTFFLAIVWHALGWQYYMWLPDEPPDHPNSPRTRRGA